MSPFLNTAQAAEFLGVCTKTLKRWDKAGKLPAHRTPGGHRRYTREELMQALGGSTQRHQVPARSESSQGLQS